MSAFTDEEIVQAWKLARKGWSRRVIARVLGRSVSGVNQILRGARHRTWGPVVPPRVWRSDERMA